jgi:general secretion pathway protein J
MKPTLLRSARFEQGFTLLEVLVAIAIFAILSAAGYQTLQGVVKSNEISVEHSLRLRQLQRTMLFMERDFGQMAGRLVRANGDVGTSLMQAGDYLLGSESGGITFVRSGWRNPQALFKRSGLQYVGYLQQGDKLIKRYFVHPDSVSGAEPKEMVLLDGVESLAFRFFYEGKWLTSWTAAEQLPQGVEVILTLSDYGEVRRVFLSVPAEATDTTESAQEESD